MKYVVSFFCFRSNAFITIALFILLTCAIDVPRADEHSHVLTPVSVNSVVLDEAEKLIHKQTLVKFRRDLLPSPSEWPMITSWYTPGEKYFYPGIYPINNNVSYDLTSISKSTENRVLTRLNTIESRAMFGAIVVRKYDELNVGQLRVVCYARFLRHTSSSVLNMPTKWAVKLAKEHIKTLWLEYWTMVTPRGVPYGETLPDVTPVAIKTDRRMLLVRQNYVAAVKRIYNLSKYNAAGDFNLGTDSGEPISLRTQGNFKPYTHVNYDLSNCHNHLLALRDSQKLNCSSCYGVRSYLDEPLVQAR